MEKKDSDNTQGRSKEKKEDKDRKDKKRVSVYKKTTAHCEMGFGKVMLVNLRM